MNDIKELYIIIYIIWMIITPLDLIPKQKYESIHYKLIYKLEKLINKSDHPNIIIYGETKCGKTTIIKLLFNDLIKVKTINNESFHMINYGNYYYFDCKNIFNKHIFIKYLKEICNNIEYIYSYKYIILDSFEYVNVYIQDCLKVIIEKSCLFSKFIIITTNINLIKTPIKSLCLNIRISSPKFYDKYIYLKRVFKDNQIIFNETVLLYECRKSKLANIINKYLSCDTYRDISLYYVNEIIDVFYKPFSLIKIRKISQVLKELNISYILNSDLIDQLQLIIKKKPLIMVIKEISRYEHNIQLSYRDILFIESLLISLYNILNELL